MQFRYEGVASGSPVTGVIEAENMDAAVRNLSARGVTVRKLSAETSPQRMQSAAPPRVAPSPTISHRQRMHEFQVQVMDERGEVEWIEAPALALEELAKTLADRRQTLLNVRNAPTRGKQLGRYQAQLIFAQLSSYLRSGHSPAHSLDELAQHQMGGAEVAQAMRHTSMLVGQGDSIANGFAARPDLFLPSVAGMLRAGQVGGFLPEACNSISESMDLANRLRRWGWVLWVAVFNLCLMVPLAGAFRSGLFASWKAAESGGGTSEVIVQNVKAIMWPWAPIAFGTCILLTLAFRWLQRARYTYFRHRLAFKTPILGARSKHESIAIFAWTLAKLSETGINAGSAWWLAADAVPNLEVGRRLKVMGGTLREGSPLSQAAIDQDLLPPEFRSMLVTGEATGDIPGALHRVSQAAFQRFEWMEKLARGAVLHTGLSLMLVAAGVALIVIAIAWYRELPAKVLDGLEAIPFERIHDFRR